MKTLAFRRNGGHLMSRAGFRSRAYGIVTLLIVSLASPGRAENYERGRQLYENHCQACHSTLLHSPVKSQIKSFTELEARVSSWSVHAAKDWSTDEVRDVSYYLDRTFYHFGVRTE